MTAHHNSSPRRLALAKRLIHAGRALLASADEQVRYRNFAEAERCFWRAVDILLEGVGPDDPHLALVWERLATLYDRLGDVDRAETCYLRSLAVQQAAGWPPVVCDERTVTRLARLYGRMGKEGLQLAVLANIDARRPCSCRRHRPVQPVATTVSGEQREARSA